MDSDCSLVKVVKLFLFKLIFDFFNQLLTDNRWIRIKTIAHCTESGQSRWHYRVAATASVAICGSSCDQAWQWLPPPFLDFHSSRTFKLWFSGWSGTVGGMIILHSHLHMAHTCLPTLEICILWHYHQPLWCHTSVCDDPVLSPSPAAVALPLSVQCLWRALAGSAAVSFAQGDPMSPCTDCLSGLLLLWSHAHDPTSLPCGIDTNSYVTSPYHVILLASNLTLEIWTLVRTRWNQWSIL